MKLLLYCTKAKNKSESLMISCKGEFKLAKDFLYITDYPKIFNGKIVAECDFEVEKIRKECVGVCKYCYRTKTLDEYDLMYKTQLDGKSMNEYLQGKGYAIHIKNLHIFDEPRELDFYSSNFDYFKKVERAPQNMMRVWEDKESPRVLISIRPEWLCKILNGEKTIEIRKKVLKEMLEQNG